MDLTKLKDERQFTTKEKNLHGDCFVQYTYEHNDAVDYQVVTKNVVHLKDCVNRRYRQFNNLMGRTCNADPSMEKKFMQVLQNPDHAEDYASVMTQSYTPTEPLFSEATTSFWLAPVNGDVFKIQKIFSFGNIIVQPFTEEGASHVTVSNSTLTLKEVKASSDDITVSGEENFDNVEFEFEHGEWKWDQDVDMKKREHLFATGFFVDEEQSVFVERLQHAIDHFVSEMYKYKINYHTKDEVEEMHKDGIQRVIPYMYSLNYDSLHQLKEIFFSDITEAGVYKRNVFTEILPMAGTNPAAYLIKEMVENNEFDSDADAARAVTSVPFHIRRPTKTLVKLYEELLSVAETSTQTFTKMAIPLAFANIVRRTCELTTPHPYQPVDNENNRYAQEKKACFHELQNPYVQMFYDKFDAINEDNSELLDHYLMVLYNFKWGKTYDLLKPIVLGETKHKHNYAVRTMAIFAISPMALAKGLEKEFFLPVFLDTHENHEVRIAAFDVLMRGAADSTVMSKIMKKMVIEKDNEVFNYVYTAFEKFAESFESTCNHNLEEYATFFLKYWKQHMWMRPSYGFGISKTYGKIFKKEKYGYSGSFEWHTTGSHKSATPLSMMFDVRAQHFEHHTMQLFGGYIRIQGLAKKLMEKVRHMTTYNPQQWNIDELKDILFSQMNIRERSNVPVEVDLVLMMKDTVVFQRHYNEESVAPGGKLFNFFMDIVALGKEYNINHQRGLMFGSVLYEQPTEYGVPMAYMSAGTSLASFQAKITRGQDSGAMLRKVDYKIQINTQAENTMAIFNLATNTMFQITQDRVYNHRFGSQISGVLNLPKSQIRVTIERPEFGEPMSMVMHSHTTLSVRGNKMTHHETELSRSCPTCEHNFEVTKGSQEKHDRYFLNHDNEEWGFHVEGKYFDCEAQQAKSHGEMFNVVAQAFNPVTKHPKDLFTAVTMGFRQMHSFLLYYPKVESCGVGFSWSQSKFNPVEKIELSFTGQMKTLTRPESVFNGKKFYVEGEVIFHGDVDRVHHLNMKYEFEPMFSKNELAIKLTRNPFRLNARDYPPFTICFDANNRYPIDTKEELSLDFSTDQKVKADVSLSWGQHTSCNNNPGKVQIIGEHQTTQEAKQDLKNKWYYHTCMQQKESPEWKASSFPVTDACFYTAMDLYTIRDYKWTATFQSLEPWMITGYRKLETLVKTGLFPFWQIKLDNKLARQTDFPYSTNMIDSYSPVVVITQKFHSEQNTFDMTIQTNRDLNEFKGVNYGYWDWNVEPYMSFQESTPSFTSLRNTHLSSLRMKMAANNLIGMCSANTKSIRTFDNVTYSYDMHNCWTMVSAHCAPVPTYAVFMKKSPKFINDVVPKMEVKMYVGGHEVNIKPITHAKFEVNIAGQEVVLGEHESYYWPTNQKLSRNQDAPENYKFKVYRWQKKYYVESYMNVAISTDGNHVSVSFKFLFSKSITMKIFDDKCFMMFVSRLLLLPTTRASPVECAETSTVITSMR